MYQQTTEKQVYYFVSSNLEKVTDIKLMRVSKPYGFNSMEGFQCDIRLKIETTTQFKNLLLEFTINSSHLEYAGIGNFKEYANIMVDNLLMMII